MSVPGSAMQLLNGKRLLPYPTRIGYRSHDQEWDATSAVHHGFRNPHSSPMPLRILSATADWLLDLKTQGKMALGEWGNRAGKGSSLGELGTLMRYGSGGST